MNLFWAKKRKTEVVVELWECQKKKKTIFEFYLNIFEPKELDLIFLNILLKIKKNEVFNKWVKKKLLYNLFDCLLLKELCSSWLELVKLTNYSIFSSPQKKKKSFCNFQKGLFFGYFFGAVLPVKMKSISFFFFFLIFFLIFF